jgi:hypothetical protein
VARRAASSDLRKIVMQSQENESSKSRAAIKVRIASPPSEGDPRCGARATATSLQTVAPEDHRHDQGASLLPDLLAAGREWTGPFACNRGLVFARVYALDPQG